MKHRSLLLYAPLILLLLLTACSSEAGPSSVTFQAAPASNQGAVTFVPTSLATQATATPVIQQQHLPVWTYSEEALPDTTSTCQP